MDKFSLKPHVGNQQRIFMWGALVGFCGKQAGMPVCFLAGHMDKLTADEKADVIEFVVDKVGDVRRTNQTKEAFNVIESRANSSSG